MQTESAGPARADNHSWIPLDAEVMPNTSKKEGAGLVRLVAVLIVLAIAGVPLVAYLWETLNGLLAGHVDAQRLLVSIPVLLLFVLLLGIMARVLGRLSQATTPTHPRR